MAFPFNSLLLDVLDVAPLGAYAVDSEGIIIYWNVGAQRILGYESELVVGRSCEEVLWGSVQGEFVPVCFGGCLSFFRFVGAAISPVHQIRVPRSSGVPRLVTVEPVLLPVNSGGSFTVVHLLRDDGLSAATFAEPDSGLDWFFVEKVPPLGVTPREAEIFRWLADGYRPDAIAQVLGISRHTVLNHIRNCREKLGVADRLEAIMVLQKMGVL